MAVATSTAIRHIIVREYKKDSPAFVIIDLLQQAFRKALALENMLSVDDAAPGHEVSTRRAQLMDTVDPPHRAYVTTGITTASGTSTNITLGGNEMMSSDEYDRRHGRGQTGPAHRGERARQSESLRDQVLSALDQAVTRRTNGDGVRVDRLSSVVQAIPHLETIYPDPAERARVMQAIQHELKARLGDSGLAADPVEPAPRRLELDPHSAEDGHPTTITTAPDNGVEEQHP